MITDKIAVVRTASIKVSTKIIEINKIDIDKIK
jgi:hypothetical protein